jgi:hypothetical protein
MRILVSGVVGAFCALAGCMALGVSIAPAAVTHEYLSKITEVPAVGPHGETVPVHGPLEEATGMTVDSGELYVASGSSNSSLDKFNASSGAFVSQFAQVPPPVYDLRQSVAVGHKTGEAETYVTGDESGPETVGLVAVFGPTGALQALWKGADTPSKGFACFECGPRGAVAVDNSASLAEGDVYVTDPGHRVVDVFKPEAGGGEKYVTQLTGPETGVLFNSMSSVAVSQLNGDVLVLEGSTVVDVFEPTALNQYALVRRLTGTPAGSFERASNITVDGGNGDIYVAEGERGIIDQFSAEGVYLGRMTGTGTPAGVFGAIAGLAVDPATHDVYVGDRAEGSSFVDIFGPSIVVPDVTTGTVSNLKAGSATLNGTVNPVKEGEATCRFDWGTTPAFGEVAPCSGSVPNGGNQTPVNAGLTGLQPDTTYHYRLEASNANGTNPGEAFQDREFTTTGPGIHQVWASNVASSSATLDAKINPNNSPTTYYFQYGSNSGYGTNIPAPPGAALGSGQGDVEISQHLQGLLAATTYHYRIVAVSELAPGEFETFDSPDKTFTTQAASSAFALPDGRAWEMVSPPNKQGATLESTPAEWGGLIQASAVGGAISYIANAPTEEQPQDNPAVERVQIFSSREADGWATKVIATYHDAAFGVALGNISEYTLFSEDLSLGVVAPKGNTPLSAETSERTPYLRHDTTCDSNPATCYQPFVNAGNVPPGTKFDSHPNYLLGTVQFEGGSPDLRHDVLGSEVALTSTPVEKGLYEWYAGKIQLVSVLPTDEGGAAVSGVLGQSPTTNVRNAVSIDGSRVVWKHENKLYLGDIAKGETVRIGVPEAGGSEVGAQGGNSEAVFQTASSNGSKVFFTDIARLTVDSTASGISYPPRPDLYEFDTETGKLTDLTVDANPKEHADVQGIIPGVSEDGTYVYFVARGTLATGAIPGRDNLYVSHAGVTSFIGTLSGDETNGTVSNSLEGLTARVSPNGLWLAFMSDASLTGYDNRDAISGAPDEEVFLYDANASRLRCASCNPTGARPAGVLDESNYPGFLFDHAFIWSEHWLAADIPGWTGSPNPVYQPRYLSDSGRLFFNSNDALVPRDTNGTWDVYEYEPVEVGSCKGTDTTFNEASDGCVGLVSSGGAAEEAVFSDASRNGEDAYFLTSSQLVPQDYDHSLDLYDARVCTAASPCLAVPPATPPPCTTGDSCKPAPAPQPESYGAPSSETFSGVGNVPGIGANSTVKAKSVTGAQRLAKTLKVCRQKKARRKRVTCERQARKRYARKAAGRSAAGKSLSVRTGH